MRVGLHGSQSFAGRLFGTRIPSPAAPASLAEVHVESGSDLDLRLQVRDRPRVFGSVAFDCKSDCGSAAKAQPVSIEIYPMFHSFATDPALIGSNSTIDKNGDFQMQSPLSGPVQLSIHPLPSGVFVKRVIYDGADVGTTFMPDSAPNQMLQIVLSDQPLELNGIVQREGQPIANANVILSPWPLIGGDAWAAATVVQTDSAGKFSFHNLGAGTYRAVSSLPSEWVRKDRPDVLAEFLASAEDITLSANGPRFVILK